MNPIAQRIRDARTKAKMTEKELAKKCGLSANYILAIESGKKIINENAASSILRALGESVEVSFSDYIDAVEEKPVKPQPVRTAPAKPAIQPNLEPISAEAEAQWAGALVNIIRDFPIHEIRSNKRVGSKELPTLNKKMDDVPWEKLLLFRASDDDAAALRIQKDDTIWVEDTKAVQKDGIHLVEWQNKKQIVYIKKEYGQLIISRGTADRKTVTVEAKEVRVIGRCFKVEFGL